MSIPTLEEISLCAITLSFGNYTAAFKNSKLPWKHRKFLTRFYSEKIFVRLKGERHLKAAHFDVLINEHVKELDIRGIDRFLLPALIPKLQIFGKLIQSLKASLWNLEEKLFEPLMSSLPNVKYINLDGDPRLEMYEAIGTNCALLNVLEIDLYSDFFLDDQYIGISFVLQHCPCLEILRHPDIIQILYRMHKDDGLINPKDDEPALEDCRNYALTTLSSWSSSYPVSDALKVCASVCPYVSNLRMSQIMSIKELEMIANFSRLESIEIGDIFDISMSDFNEFLVATGHKFTNVELPYKSYLSIACLIESCPRLQSLKLHNQICLRTRPSESPCKALLEDLKILEFSQIHFEIEENAEVLKALLLAAKGVRKLVLHSCCGLHNKLLGNLDLKRVYELDASRSDIQVETLKDLFLSGSLRILNIVRCSNIKTRDYENLIGCLSQEQRNSVDIKWSTYHSSH